MSHDYKEPDLLETLEFENESKKNVRHTDSLAQYIKEAKKTKRLTPNEEKALAKQARRGDDAARKRLITANLFLVIKVARRYVGHGIPILDLIQEGNIGLMTAVQKFTPERDCRFSTCAYWWIRQAITRSILNSKYTIRIPIHLQAEERGYLHAKNAMETELGRVPSLRETTARMDLKNIRKFEKTVATLWKVRALSLEETALTTDDGDSGWDRGLADDAMPTPEENCVADSERELLQTLLAALKPKERTILELRFGLNGNHEHTLDEIGDNFLNVTRDRVRQIQLKALKKLRKRRNEVIQDYSK